MKLNKKAITTLIYNVGIGPPMQESEQNGIVIADRTRPFLGYEDAVYCDNLFEDLIILHRRASELGIQDLDDYIYTGVIEAQEDPDKYALNPAEQFCIPRPYDLDHIEVVETGENAGIYVFDRGDKDGICGIFNRGGAIRPESFIPKGYRERVYEVFVGSGLFERLEAAGYYL
jgi:hypothetical protein